jgi:hypothetical protein
MTLNKQLLYAIMIAATINSGYALEKPFEKAYHIDWPYNSNIHQYCRKKRGRHQDEDCVIMHNYIIARAVAGRINNYKVSQEKKLTQNKEELAKINAINPDNCLTEFELDARKSILLEKQKRIESNLATIPAIKERMTDDEFLKVVQKIITKENSIKANIISDKDVARELNFVLEILKKADETTVDKYFFY